MKAVILAGGRGTRISEESISRPKPLIEVGARPLLWHIMKLYGRHGIHDFVICLGYKGHLIKEYFANYFLRVCDITIDLKNHTTRVHRASAEPWTVTLVDTGEHTMTGGRLKRVQEYLGDGDFCLTYGDGLSNVDITALLAFHRQHGRLATVTATRPPGRFGALQLEDDDARVRRVQEKPPGDGGWINGGFFVLSPSVLGQIEGDATVLERETLQKLACEGELAAYRHSGFWHPIDTLRDKLECEQLWAEGRAPWKVWE